MLDRERDARIARLLPEVCARYARHAERCRQTLARGGRLRVMFVVCDASMFTAEPVFRRMREDPSYDCRIAVVPRVTRGEKFLCETLDKTYALLSARYGSDVRLCYDVDARRATSFEGEADVVFTSVIYEEQSCPEYTVAAMSAYALVCVLSYGYGGLFKNNVARAIFLPNLVLSWRLFLSNQATLETWTENNPLLRRNAVVSGYAKMDRLEVERARVAVEAKDRAGRKTVLICPHHTLERDTDGLCLSTFLERADLFLRLPGMYPNVKFVFRPHPLLFVRLRTDRWWGEAKTSAYEKEMEKWPNVEFQRGGDYFATFVESDALIHDCGSFLAEYFYTGRPQCYLLESEQTEEREFLPFGRRLLAATYRAFAEEDVIRFMDRVVLGGEDPLAPMREALARSAVCVHYPDAAGRVIALVREGIEQEREHG